MVLGNVYGIDPDGFSVQSRYNYYNPRFQMWSEQMAQVGCTARGDVKSSLLGIGEGDLVIAAGRISFNAGGIFEPLILRDCVWVGAEDYKSYNLESAKSLLSTVLPATLNSSKTEKQVIKLPDDNGSNYINARCSFYVNGDFEMSWNSDDSRKCRGFMDESAGMKGVIFQRLDTKKYEFFVEKIRDGMDGWKEVEDKFFALCLEKKSKYTVSTKWAKNLKVCVESGDFNLASVDAWGDKEDPGLWR